MQQEIHPEFRTAVKRLPRTIRFVRPLLGLARSLVCRLPIPDRWSPYRVTS